MHEFQHLQGDVFVEEVGALLSFAHQLVITLDDIEPIFEETVGSDHIHGDVVEPLGALSEDVSA